jgi:predicted nuclease of predicted toxin-antitoxin system
MILKLLADENFPLPVIQGLIDAGYDVLSIAKISPGINDRAVLSLARGTGRSLLTFDVDFGDLVFSHDVEPPIAVLFFRLHPIIVEELLTITLCALNEVQPGHFVVISRERIRLRKL